MSTQKDQWNKTARPETDSIHKYVIKAILQITRTKMDFLINGVGTTEKKIRSTLHTIYKNKLQIDQRSKCKRVKLCKY